MPVPPPSPDYLQSRILVGDDGRPLSGGKFGYGPTFRGQFGEVYLELLSLDLNDTERIAEFCARYGALGMFDPIWAARLEDAPYFGFPDVPGFDYIVVPHLAWLREELELDRQFETVAEFCWGVSCIRDMVTAWELESGVVTQDEVKWSARCWNENLDPDWIMSNGLTECVPAWVDGKGLPPSYPGDSYWALTRGMQSGLVPFRPSIIPSLGETDVTVSNGPYPGHRRMEIPLYAVLCLELFNHIVENAEYKRCANEPCGRLFVRQQGRAVHRQHRTSGVKYCTADCARAQAQRQFRRRAARRSSTSQA